MTFHKPNYREDSRNRAVPNRAAAQYSARKHRRFLIALLVTGIFLANSTCNFSRKPSRLVEDFGRTLERGETDKALAFFSTHLIARLGIGPLKENLGQTAAELREHLNQSKDLQKRLGKDSRYVSMSGPGRGL